MDKKRGEGRENDVGLTIRLPGWLRTELAEWCSKRGTDQSKAVRNWIEAAIRNAPPEGNSSEMDKRDREELGVVKEALEEIKLSLRAKDAQLAKQSDLIDRLLARIEKLEAKLDEK